MRQGDKAREIVSLILSHSKILGSMVENRNFWNALTKSFQQARTAETPPSFSDTIDDVVKYVDEVIRVNLGYGATRESYAHRDLGGSTCLTYPLHDDTCALVINLLPGGSASGGTIEILVVTPLDQILIAHHTYGFTWEEDQTLYMNSPDTTANEAREPFEVVLRRCIQGYLEASRAKVDLYAGKVRNIEDTARGVRGSFSINFDG